MTWRTLTGVVLTVLLVLGAGTFAWLGWEQFSILKPNEWGDFLAGLAATLAFLWLVIGYFQQADQLRRNTDELKEHTDALRRAASGASRQASAAADLYRVERNRLEQERIAAIEQETPLLRMTPEGTTIQTATVTMRLKMTVVNAPVQDLVVEAFEPDQLRISHGGSPYGFTLPEGANVGLELVIVDHNRLPLRFGVLMSTRSRRRKGRVYMVVREIRTAGDLRFHIVEDTSITSEMKAMLDKMDARKDDAPRA